MSGLHRAGFIAIVGRPNVGKSTLLNHLVGQKISITSRKAQTTRHRIHGIVTRDDAQLIFVDTPGFQTRHGNALNRLMNRTVKASLGDVDMVLFVIEALRFDERDRQVLKLLPADRPVLLVLNKVDQVNDKKALLPFLEKMAKEFPFRALVPVAALRGTRLADLVDAIVPLLPENAPLFEPDEITDRSERFLAAEFIREKLFRLLGEELPYSTSVVVDDFSLEGNLRRIHASIVVDKENHKAMVIGKGGEKLKAIGTAARQDMEALFGGKVFLEIWVKVRSGWTEDERQLRRLGYE